MKRKKRQIVEIKWEDSAGYGSGNWQDKDRHLSTELCHSVGYIHRERKGSIELAPHVSTYATLGNMVIPRSAIRSIRKLSVDKA